VSTLRSDRLRELAGAKAGPDASWVLIDAESSQAAWGRVVRARTEAPLEESELLAHLFDAGADAGAEIVAGGPYAPLNEQVLRDAFALAGRQDLGGVHLVVVGPEPTSPELGRLCSERGATCDPVEWVGALELD